MHIVRDRSRSTCWGLQAGSGRVPSRLNCAIMSVACYTTPTAASTAHKLAPRGRPTLPHEFLVRVMVITTSKESGCVVSWKIQKINNFKFQNCSKKYYDLFVKTITFCRLHQFCEYLAITDTTNCYEGGGLHIFTF